jgi:lambda family phage minor tail protein L
MPLSLSSIAIEEKNKLATDSVLLIALKVTIPGVDDPVYMVRNNEDLTWQGQTWVAFPFDLDEISEVRGEVPQINVRICNITRALESFIQDYDAYCKNNGYSPMVVEIFVVNTKAVAANPDCDPEVSHIFELKQPKTNSKWATFVLGAANPFKRRFPQERILKNFCRYKFKGVDGRCGYAGTETECNKTLARCRALANSVRFGGFPGSGKGSVVVA